MEEPKDTYQKPYTMRSQGRDGLNTVVTIPPVVIKREAQRRNLTIPQFLDQYVAVAQYDSFEGLYYSFQPVKDNGGNSPLPSP